jgi:WD40 repeat protein
VAPPHYIVNGTKLDNVQGIGLLVTGSNDKTLRVWNMATWKCVDVLEGHSGVRI